MTKTQAAGEGPPAD